jgi:type I restriction enzyme S subunit
LPESTDDFEPIEYVEISDVSLVGGIEKQTPLFFHEAPSRARRRVRSGDILVSTVRTYLKAIAAVEEAPPNLIASTGFCVIRTRGELDSKYAGWVARSEEFVSEVVSRSVGVSYPAINSSELVNISIPLPPLDAQRRIAAFLHAKTAHIDALMAKKKKLLERLAEKRRAVITHFVTKGLNPSAPMKQSGIDWLGRIPEHWDVKRLKFLGRTRYGLGEPPQRDDEGIPFIRATDIYRGKIDLSAVQRVARNAIPWSRKPQLSAGEILVVRSGAYTGDSALITPDLAGMIAGYDMVYTPVEVRPEFAAFTLLANYMIDGQIFVAKQRAAQPHLNAEELGDFFVAVPSECEQAEIASHLSARQCQLDVASSKIAVSIEKLSEYRSAIISAAVTGGIEGLQ